MQIDLEFKRTESTTFSAKHGVYTALIVWNPRTSLWQATINNWQTREILATETHASIEVLQAWARNDISNRL